MIGIWSIAALTSLPGLAVSPIMGDLSKIFPKVSELEIQMLTSLPSLLIIPSILFAGRIAERVGYTRVLLVGLTLFFVSGVLYFFSNTISGLILISALLGVGAGMIIPLSTALVSRFFSGNYRTRQFGYVSAISNLTLVVATALTGYLADISWRLPFIVYLLPIVSITLLPQISHAESNDTQIESDKSKNSSAHEINTAALLSNMWYYFLITYIVLIISLNLPFLLESYGYRSESAGLLISLFFLAIMLPGLAIDFFKKYFGQGMRFSALVIMGAGIAMLLAFHTLPTKAIGCLVAGLGYGIAQPLIYDNTVATASPSRASYALAWVMVMNYIAILLAPFIIDFAQNIFHAKSQQFPFIFNMIIAFIAAIIYLLVTKRKG